MSSKFFKPITIGGATALISLTSFLSYAIGLIRDRVIAVNFGTSSATDTYNASFLIPDLLFNLFIAGALTAAFLPIFSEYLEKDREEAYKIANTMLTGGSLVIAFISLIAFIFMPKIIPAMFSTATPEMQTDIIHMTRLMLPSAILFAISNTLGNILMSYKHFFAYSLSPVFYNLGIILGVIFLSDSFGIYAAAIGVLIGALMHAMIRILDASFTDYRYKFEIKGKHPAIKKIIKLMIPKTIALIAWQFNLYIFAIVGIRLIEGGLAAFNFARNIQSFAVSLFGIAFATAVFPYLSSSVSKNDPEKYTVHIQKTIQRILFFTVPATVGIIVMSTEIVDLILAGGVFDQNSIKLTSLILFFFALSIPFESLVHILARAFYARQNTIIPTIINISAMIIIASITYFAAPIYGIKWFSLGFSFGMVFQVLILFIFLKKHLQNFKYIQAFVSISKTILASGIMAGIVILTKDTFVFMPEKISYLIRIVLGGVAFFGTAYIIKSDELASMNYILNRLFKKNV